MAIRSTWPRGKRLSSRKNLLDRVSHVRPPGNELPGQLGQGAAVRTVFAILCLLSVVAGAACFCHSLGGFLVLGVGSALLVDRYLLRLLPWASPVVWRTELALRVS